MGKKSKRFIDKSQSLTFQVVHRSQRDPAMADNDASKLVLKPVAASYNLLKKGKGLEMPEVNYEFEEAESDLDLDIDGCDYSQEGENWDDDEAEAEVVDVSREREAQQELAHVEAVEQLQKGPSLDAAATAESTESKATGRTGLENDLSVYGIFFKNQGNYDYSKHLKVMGEDPNAVFVESKDAVAERAKAEAKGKGIRFLDDAASVAMSEIPKRKVVFNIPSEVLASEHEDSIGLLGKAGTVNVIDIEPSMRETIYALDDEAYVEDDLDDFFDALNAEDVPEEVIQKLDPEDYFPDKEECDEKGDEENGEGDWYGEYQRYKNEGGGSDDEYEDDDDDDSYDRKTFLTALSMTSSAMVRNKHLTNLDDQFEKALQDYDDDQLGDLEGQAYDPDTLEPMALDPHQPTISQDRMDKIFDRFLESTEVVGRKGLVLNKVPESVKIDAVRNELREVTRITEEMKLSVDDTLEGGDVLDEQLEQEILQMKPDYGEHKWDVETVLTTYSNIYNHPRLIKDVMTSTRKIRLSRKGPVVVDSVVPMQPTADGIREPDEDDDEGHINDSDSEFGLGSEAGARNEGKARTKGESKEEKKARKQLVKEQKKDRRVEKKATKTAFKKEIAQQGKAMLNRKGQEIFVPVV